MKQTSNSLFLIYLLIFDMCILPTSHVFGIPFKISFVICILWYFCNITKTSIKTGSGVVIYLFDSRNALKSTYGRKLIMSMSVIIAMTVLGEISLLLMTDIINYSYTRNLLFGYILLVAFMGIGYEYYNFNKSYLVFILVLYCGINVVFSSLRKNAPYLLKSIYGIVGEDSEEAALSLRINGTLGNPNATLSLMNCIFMSIIVYYAKNMIDLNNRFKLIIVMTVPIITNLFVNSRGEFLITMCLEGVLVYFAVLKQPNPEKRMELVAVLMMMLVVGLAIVWRVLVPNYPTVQYGIERMRDTINGANYERLGASETITERPFIHAREFVDRFVISPIWGTGAGVGSEYPFSVSSSQYHNDWFGIFASSGIVGGASLMYMVYLSAKKSGAFYIVPFAVTAVSNGFVASYYAIGIYFMTVMSVIRFEEAGEINCLG